MFVLVVKTRSWMSQRGACARSPEEEGAAFGTMLRVGGWCMGKICGIVCYSGVKNASVDERRLGVGLWSEWCQSSLEVVYIMI